MTADNVDEALMRMSNELAMRDSGDYRLITAITDSMSVQARADLSQIARAEVINSITNNIKDGINSGNNQALIESSTSALRDFMEKFGATTDALTLEFPLNQLAFAIDLSDTGDYRAIDAITDNMSAAARAELSQDTRDLIISRITNDVENGFVFHDSQLTNAATAAFRDFMDKFGATTDVSVLERVLSRMFVTIGNSHTADYRTISAVMDNMTPEAIQNLDQEIRSSLIQGFTNHVGEFLITGDQPKTESALQILNDFMEKFGSSTDIETLESLIPHAANICALSRTGDYRAYYAITDNITSAVIQNLSQENRDLTISNFVVEVGLSLYTGQQNYIDNVVGVLRNFMEMFGSTTTAWALEQHLWDLAYTIHFSHTADYRSFYAIMDNMTASAIEETGQFPRSLIIEAFSSDIVDFYLSPESRGIENSSPIDKAIGVMDDFMEKFGATTDIESAEFGINNLAEYAVGDGLNAIFEHIGDDKLQNLSGETQQNLAFNRIHIETASDDINRYGEFDDIGYGLSGNDTLHGGGGNDQLYGNNGNDILYGDDGNDILVGGTGVDFLTGGKGSDTFVLDNVSVSNDVITDFSIGVDKLDISNILQGFDPLTDSILDFVTVERGFGSTLIGVDADGLGPQAATWVVSITGTQFIDVQTLYNNGQIIV